ncbi:MAG: hypothetical protein D6754_07215 [Alphaproteobacteria bacterium]|nr:MAG: hypothetical protein D6754_07215 [Alphaproteobacteria bacterium]
MAYDYDLGRYSRPVTAASAEAQRWFDRGLIWTYGYNHEEARRCFDRALAADPDCAMAHWGLGYAAGPNYNYEWWHMDPDSQAEALATAYDASRRALALADRVTAPERALIAALAARYPRREPAPDMVPWNHAFADAMRTVHAGFPGDLDIATVFAESLLNLTPWRMWDLKTGEPAPHAVEARRVLEDAFEIPAAWDHPGLLHLYVHLMEMSPTPELALRHGDRLRTLVPASGHLVHMPTHIDVLCGQYHDVLAWNERASEADRVLIAAEGPYGIYHGYWLHNLHFAAYGAMFLGQFAPALAAARKAVEVTPESLLRIESPPIADFFESYMGFEPHVLIRFGRWEDIIAARMPTDRDLYRNLTANWLYAKGVAHAARGEVEGALAMQRRFREARARIPESRLLHNCRCVDLQEVGDAMLEGEIAYRIGDHDRAFDALRLAVAREDALPYDEPWGWMQPSRHALGALLLEQGRLEEAEAVYRADLGLDDTVPRACQHPGNVWALHGLHQCLTRLGRTGEARLIAGPLAIAAARADAPPRASCMCATAA